MRPLLTLLGTVLLLGSIYAYTEFAERVKRSATVVELQQARGEYSVAVTCTLDCAANRDFQLPAVEILLGDKTVLSRTEKLSRMTPLLVEKLPGVVAGRNEIIVQAHIGATEIEAEVGNDLGCLRIQIFRDGAPIAEQSFWSEPGQPVLVGAVMFDASTEFAQESP